VGRDGKALSNRCLKRSPGQRLGNLTASPPAILYRQRSERHQEFFPHHRDAFLIDRAPPPVAPSPRLAGNDRGCCGASPRICPCDMVTGAAGQTAVQPEGWGRCGASALYALLAPVREEAQSIPGSAVRLQEAPFLRRRVQ